MALNLYRISKSYKCDDKYDSAVVAAMNANDARIIHPIGFDWTDGDINAWEWTQEWTMPENVSVDYLGVADESLERGVICASFNAG